MGLRLMHHAARSSRLNLVGALAFGLLCASSHQALGAPSNTKADHQGARHHAHRHEGGDQQTTYEALVRRTAGGIPHIIADDFGSIGFGTGYAMAEDIICLLADDRFLTFAAERSRFLGPGGGNLQSDFFYKLFIDRGEALEPIDRRQAAVFRGAAAGYNRYLRDTGVDNLPDSSCRGKPWVREISDVDFRRISRMNFFLPYVSSLIVAATPPAPSPAVSATTVPSNKLSPDEQQAIRITVRDVLEPLQDLGSNAIALGRDATTTGRGMLLANPHLGWRGGIRFYAFHQTLPGQFNIMGANLVGRPQVGFGTTEHVAWTSTVSTASRNTFYQLTLVPGNPTQYLFDGQPRDMIAETVTVQVPDGNGGFENRSHTFYSTLYGAYLVGGSLPWNQHVAYAVRATLDEWRGINSLLEQYRAKSVRELKAVHDAYQFSPSNMIAADSTGEAYYADPGPTPNLSGAQLATCAVPGGLDGSRSECMWNSDPEAAIPGILSPRHLPSLIRRDFVTNSNDSFWLANPAQPLTGFNASLGSVESERTLRTRSGLTMVQQRLAGTDGGAGSRFTLEQLQALMLSNQTYTGQILRDGLVSLCQRNPQVTLASSLLVDISAACPVLQAWDLHDDLDSRGAHLFREVMRAANGGDRLPAAWNYLVPFDVSDPVNTPRGLDPTNNPAALQALATAVQRLRDANIALDARLGDVQYVVRNGERIPIHGGTGASGLFNIITSPFAGVAGYPEVSSGASWIQATAFTQKGPVSRGILTYSLSPNPDSPHYADQTKLFSQKQWLDLPFHEKDVKAAAITTLRLAEGKDDCKGQGWRRFRKPHFPNQGACVSYFEKPGAHRIRD